MRKQLSEMTLQELWKLFPIFLVEPKDEWKQWYEEEAHHICDILPGEKIVQISHIGSTAIPGIWAKNIVDILLEVPAPGDLPEVKNQLMEHGWLCMSQSDSRISLNKGYTLEGFAQRVFHLHLRISGDHDEIYFRNYLIQNPSVAKEYEKLKLSLWNNYEHDRDGYTEAKGDFIRKYTEIAKEEGRLL